MSTLPPDTVKERDALGPASSTVTAPESARERAGTSGGKILPPPPRPPRTGGPRWLNGIALVAVVAIIAGLGTLAVLQLTRHPTSTVGPTPTATTAPTPTAVTVMLGPQVCPAGVADLAHWQPIINAYEPGGGATAAKVECATLLGVPSLQALVTAQHADQTLDALVFTNITTASPSALLQVKGLLKGDAKISAYSTILTAEVDQHSSVNAGKSLAAMTPDLFREFAWSSARSAMQQTAFQGIFPDLTRYQAEADQAAVNQGHEPWKLSPTSVASAMVTTVLGWPAGTSVSATLLSGGGPQDTQASVAVSGQLLGPTATVTVALARLGDQRQSGIWEVVAVTAQGYAFTSPAPLSQLDSPVTVTGTGSAFEGDVGHVSLLDHLYTSIVRVRADGAQGMGPTTFTATLNFTPTYTAGVQEGVLMIMEDAALMPPVPAVLEKVLINGAR